MSVFDADTFLNQEYSESTDTTITPVPIGEYLAQVEKISAKSVETSDGEERIIMKVLWNILDEEVKKEMGQDKVLIGQDIFLDVTEEGNIDNSKGKNRQLGLLREATGKNKQGKPWSPQDLIGASATIATSQRHDKDDPEVIYSGVKKVLKA